MSRSSQRGVCRVICRPTFRRRHVPLVKETSNVVLRATGRSYLTRVIRPCQGPRRRRYGGHLIGRVNGLQICPPACRSFVRPSSWARRGLSFF